MQRITILLLLVSVCGCNERQPIKTGFEGNPIPGFTILLPDSTTYLNTLNIPSGKPIVLFYFSPKCPYCRIQMNSIINGMEALKNIRFVLFTNYPFRDMKRFYLEFHLEQYQNISVGIDFAYAFQHQFKTNSVPYTAIYGNNGLLKRVFLGGINAKNIKSVTE